MKIVLIGCILLASKQNEIKPIQPSLCISKNEKNYNESVTELKNIELEIMKKLKF